MLLEWTQVRGMNEWGNGENSRSLLLQSGMSENHVCGFHCLGAAEPDSGRAPTDGWCIAESAGRCWTGNWSTACITHCCSKQQCCGCAIVPRSPWHDCRQSDGLPSWTQGWRTTVWRGLTTFLTTHTISLCIIGLGKFYTRELQWPPHSTMVIMVTSCYWSFVLVHSVVLFSTILCPRVGCFMDYHLQLELITSRSSFIPIHFVILSSQCVLGLPVPHCSEVVHSIISLCMKLLFFLQYMSKVIMFILCCSIFWYGFMLAFDVWNLVSQEISWEERLQNDLILCLVECNTWTQSISQMRFYSHFSNTQLFDRLSVHNCLRVFGLNVEYISVFLLLELSAGIWT